MKTKKRDEKKVTNIKNLKNQMRELIKNIEEYKKQFNILEDKFIKNLCLDIAICYKTLGTELGHMYSCSRQTSQGSQRIHSVRTPRKNKYSLTPNFDSDDDSVFTGLQSPRKNKNHKIESFDSLDHLLNDSDKEDEIICKYIDDDMNELNELNNDVNNGINNDDLNSPHYCSQALMNAIKSVSEK